MPCGPRLAPRNVSGALQLTQPESGRCPSFPVEGSDLKARFGVRPAGWRGMIAPRPCKDEEDDRDVRQDPEANAPVTGG